MHKKLSLLLFMAVLSGYGQEVSVDVKHDSTVTEAAAPKNPLNTGYYPLGFFNVDLRYLVKYNNYEGIRLGFGGITNNRLSEKIRFGGYVARGFKDKDMKYSLGANLRINKNHNTWLSAYYINDIKEIGALSYLTDARVYSVFEPRLLNITQFYQYRTWQANIQHEFSPKIFSEFRISHSAIDNIENYFFLDHNTYYHDYKLAEVTASVRISPKTNFFTNEDGLVEYFDGLPKISAQITQGIKGIGDSDFNYTKFALKFDYYIKHRDLSATNILLEGSLALGDVPLTHLYHAYPNQPTKDEILQRFSVAGVQSFETMYFGEFFSDKLTTLQFKQSLRRFNISKRIKPELVFITRLALGDMKNIERHQGIPFNTLNQLYTESGLELNKILFGFGLSFAYRYGYYHLPDFEDNISAKFTFYMTF